MKFNIKDLIQLGIFAAIYFILVGISGLICILVFPGYSFLYIPVIAALLSGTIFMLTAVKIQKFGAITFLATVMGLFFFISGLFPQALLPAIGFGLLADIIAYFSHYERKWGLLFSYIIFSFSNFGPILPLLFDPEDYVDQLLIRGKDHSYINQVFSLLFENAWLVVLLGTIIAAILSGLFGIHMLNKHFRKAGVVK